MVQKLIEQKIVSCYLILDWIFLSQIKKIENKKHFQNMVKMDEEYHAKQKLDEIEKANNTQVTIGHPFVS